VLLERESYKCTSTQWASGFDLTIQYAYIGIFEVTLYIDEVSDHLDFSRFLFILFALPIYFLVYLVLYVVGRQFVFFCRG